MKRSIFMATAVSLVMSFSSLNASTDSDYVRAEMGMSATMIPKSRSVCHRATGNLSSCTTKISCGGYTLWPTASFMRDMSRYSGKIQITTVKSRRKLCRLK